MLIYTVCGISCINPFPSSPFATILVVFGLGDLQVPPQQENLQFYQSSLLLHFRFGYRIESYFLFYSICTLQLDYFSPSATLWSHTFLRNLLCLSTASLRTSWTDIASPSAIKLEVIFHSFCYSPSESCSTQTGTFIGLSHSGLCSDISQSGMSTPPTGLSDPSLQIFHSSTQTLAFQLILPCLFFTTLL